MVAAAMAGIAVVADPAERRAGAALDRLGPVGEAGDRRPAGVAFAGAIEGNEVDGEPVVVVGVPDVAVVAADVFAAGQWP